MSCSEPSTIKRDMTFLNNYIISNLFIENLSLVNARKKVISAVNPKLRLDGKSEAYITAAYDIAKQSVANRRKVDGQRKRIMKGRNFDSIDAGSAGSSAASARENMIARRENKTVGGKD